MQSIRSLPNTWRRDSIRSIVDPLRPITYGVVQPGERLKEGIPIIRGQDYSRGVVDDSDLYLIHPHIAGAYVRSTVEDGDILFSIVGYLGQTAVVPPTLSGANITQTTARIAVKRPNQPRFFLHQFRSNGFFPEVRKYQKGSAQPGLNLADVERMLVFIPPPIDQARIAGVLDAVDEVIAKTEAVIAKLRQVRAGLLHDLLTRGLDENGQLRDPVSHPEQFQESPIGQIPKAWTVGPLREFGNAARPYLKTGPFGASLKQEHWVSEGVPVVTIGSLGEGEFILSEILHVSEETARALAAYSLVPGDIVFSRVADVGRSVVVTQAERGWIMSSNMMWISLDPKKADPFYTQLNISTNAIVRRQIERLVNSAGREVANAAVMNSLRLPWAPPTEQSRIVQVLRVIDASLDAEHVGLRKSYFLKAGLMNDLLTGRVRVPKSIVDCALQP